MAYKCTYRLYDYGMRAYRPCGFVADTKASLDRHQDTHYNAYFPDKAKDFEVVRDPRHPDTVQSSLLGGEP